MFRILNEKELRECFRETEREEVIWPTERPLPVVSKDYLAWIEPSGCRAYLVFQGENFKTPFGMVFRRDQTLGPAVAAMCEWCHAVRSGNEVGLLTVASSRKKRLGLSLCRDLSCAEKIRGAPGANDFPSTASVQTRIERLIAKMTELTRRELI